MKWCFSALSLQSNTMPAMGEGQKVPHPNAHIPPHTGFLLYKQNTPIILPRILEIPSTQWIGSPCTIIEHAPKDWKRKHLRGNYIYIVNLRVQPCVHLLGWVLALKRTGLVSTFRTDEHSILFETSRPNRLFLAEPTLTLFEIYTWLYPQVYYLFIVSSYISTPCKASNK